MDHLLEQKRARHRRFWQPLERGEGGYLAVMSPIQDGQPLLYRLEPPTSLEEQWLSADYCVRRAEAEYQNNYWGLDAAPRIFVNLGPGVHAALLGGPYELQSSSIWFDLNPPIKGWDPAPVFKTRSDHELFRVIEDQTRALCAASGGRYAVSFTDIGGTLDVLFSLRGEELLSDLVEYPDHVLDAQRQLDDEFLAYFDYLRGIIAPTGCGYTNWIPMLCDDPWYPLQCDLSVMISPAMFERFVLPSLDRLSRSIGRAIYHLDGPGEIAHLDMILSLPNVHAIQWVPVPTARLEGGGYFQDFTDAMSLDIFRRTLAAGKKLVLLRVRPEQIATIYDAVGCDGVYIQTSCDTRAQADELVAEAQRRWIR